MSEVVTLPQISAGGVVYRLKNGHPEVVLISVGNPPRWQLPKGMIDRGESAEIAARREVQEEAGVDSELLEPLETIEYWYFANQRGRRVRFHKQVHFFLFRYLTGDPANHDHEVSEARWVDLAEAEEMVRFDSEKKVLRRAKELIQEIENLSPGVQRDDSTGP